MRRARGLVLVTAIGAAVLPFACSLNPQPLPPDQGDGSAMGLDAAGGGPDGNLFGDAANSPDAAVPGTDSGTRADGAAEDADAGGSDAETDAWTEAGPDSSVDASDDGSADAASD